MQNHHQEHFSILIKLQLRPSLYTCITIVTTTIIIFIIIFIITFAIGSSTSKTKTKKKRPRRQKRTSMIDISDTILWDVHLGSWTTQTRCLLDGCLHLVRFSTKLLDLLSDLFLQSASLDRKPPTIRRTQQIARASIPAVGV